MGLRFKLSRSMITPWSFSPLVLHPALWLDASSPDTLLNGTAMATPDQAISQWSDKSGNGRHATQSTGVNQPLRKTAIQNGRDVVEFDGANDTLQISSVYDLAAFSIFAVAKTTVTSATGKSIYGHGTSANNYSRDALLYFNNSDVNIQRSNNTNFPTATIASTVGNFCLAETSYNGSSLTISRNAVDGTPVATSISGSATDSINIGAVREALTTVLFLPGDIGELIVFNSTLSTPNRDAIRAYLNTKWSLY